MWPSVVRQHLASLIHTFSTKWAATCWCTFCRTWRAQPTYLPASACAGTGSGSSTAFGRSASGPFSPATRLKRFFLLPCSHSPWLLFVSHFVLTTIIAQIRTEMIVKQLSRDFCPYGQMTKNQPTSQVLVPAVLSTCPAATHCPPASRLRSDRPSFRLPFVARCGRERDCCHRRDW